MKITIYELLGLIKDGKAPKKIKCNGLLWKLCDDVQDYTDTERYLLADHMVDLDNRKDFLNEEVKIIKEEKNDNFTGWKMYKDGKEVMSMNYSNQDKEDKDIEELDTKKTTDFGVEYVKENRNKINELIKEVNKLKGKHE